MCLVNCDCVCWCDRMYNANMPFHLLSSFDSTCRVYHQLSLCNACELFLYAIRKPIINYCFNKLRFDWVRAAISYGDRWAIKLFHTTCVRIRHETREREEKREKKTESGRSNVDFTEHRSLFQDMKNWFDSVSIGYLKLCLTNCCCSRQFFPPFERM